MIQPFQGHIVVAEIVMCGLDPRIFAKGILTKMDCRVKPGNDGRK
jgi:hypothetical protein